MNDNKNLSWWTRDEGQIREIFRDRIKESLPQGAEAVFQAAEHATRSHGDKERKAGGGRYVIHPLRVAITLLAEFGLVQTDFIIAALLHDVIEDTNESYETLVSQYGCRIADAVRCVSRSEEEKRGPSGDHLESPYLQRIRSAGAATIALKLADKLDNLRESAFLPDEERRQVYLQETYLAYLPLLLAVQDRALRTRILRIYLGILPGEVKSTSPGQAGAFITLLNDLLDESKDGRIEAQQLPQRGLGLVAFNLFNPLLRFWLEDEEICISKKQYGGCELAAKVARTILQKIRAGELALLLSFAGVPIAFAGQQTGRHWRRVQRELELIQQGLFKRSTLAWLKALCVEENLPRLLLLIQSRLFLPASWTFPIWHTDIGATLAQNLQALYGGFEPDTVQIREWIRAHSVMLINRGALYRYLTGQGSAERLEAVFAAAQGMQTEQEVLWALRLGSEYLNEASLLQEEEDDPEALDFLAKTMDDLWHKIVDKPFSFSSLGSFLCKGSEPGWARQMKVPRLETLGVAQTRKLFQECGMESRFDNVLSILSRQHDLGSLESTWICFQPTEWEKRRRFWACSEAFTVNSETTFCELEAKGVRVVTYTMAGVQVLQVLPARKFALQDRLPEINPGELEAIAARDYAAAGIFDVLIAGRIRNPEGGPLWIPRVYRILDSMEDLDPVNVQTIIVTFVADEPVPPLKAFLPLPISEEEAKSQKERKQLVARYIVAQVYNTAVIRWLRSASFHCSAVPKEHLDFAFSDIELAAAITAAEKDWGYKARFGIYLDQYNFDAFSVKADSSLPDDTPFNAEDMYWGLFLGIDIGGTRVKYSLFQNGNPLAGKSETASLDTFESGSSDPVEVTVFCRRILNHISAWLPSGPAQWAQVDSIGISWPGSVRNNRIAAISNTLRRLKYNSVPFTDNDPLHRLAGFDFADTFLRALEKLAQEKNWPLKQGLVVALQNDGDAEAFGNYCLRVMHGKGKSEGGKIFVKLGTSLAGGRIKAMGAIAEEIAEYAKLTLDFKTQPSSWPPGTTRDFVSSLGVRNLSRTFRFENEIVFGPRASQNAESARERIEAVELGELLLFWRLSDPASALLPELIASDNLGGGPVVKDLLGKLPTLLRSASIVNQLGAYIMRRGAEAETRGQIRARVSRWILGLSSLHWLCAGEPGSYEGRTEGVIPSDFPMDLLAKRVVGSVALFSELALRIAHTIALLYNIYRRETFKEVVLSGGVLGGMTGPLVKQQVEAFLLKYYDKIFGPGRPLPEDAIALAGLDDPSIAGPLGAAQAANRRHKLEFLRLMRRQVDLQVGQMQAGDRISVGEIQKQCGARIRLPEICSYLESKVAAAALIPEPEAVGIYVKTDGLIAEE